MARLAGGFVRHARNMNTRGCLVANGWVASHPDEYAAELWRGCAATYGLRWALLGMTVSMLSNAIFKRSAVPPTLLVGLPPWR